MKYGPIEIKDKLGRTVVLRNAEPSDAEDLIKYLKTTTEETPFLIREPDEVTLTAEQEANFINLNINDEKRLMLIATVDGKHIGNCSLAPIGSFRRYAHRCDVAIALYQEYCSTGIGNQMLSKILEIAKSLGYEQAELEVVSENKNAIALYEKLGFVKYGTLPDNMKYADGSYTSTDWMMKKL